ncbi:MAG: hypothetical protein ACYSSP_02580 [Planctomycetota bacterium]|jgi:hypothetical protein
MKSCILITSLFALLVPSVAFAQEEPFEEGPGPMEEMEHQLNMQEAQLQLQQKKIRLQQQKMELEFWQQKNQIELEKQKIELEHQRRGLSEHAGNEEHYDEGEGLAEHAGQKEHHDEGGGVILVIIFIVNILLAVWVYTDIRKRNSGSGIWIIVVLLTGLLGVIPYAIVRLGNIPKPV